MYESANSKEEIGDLKKLHNQGFTLRDIEILTGISKSQASREISV